VASYGLSVLVVCALGLGIAVTVFRSTLRAHRRLLGGLVAVLAVPLAAIEGLAIRWGMWAYTSGKVVPFRLLGTQPETYLFSALVVFNFSLLALGIADRVDRRHPDV